MDEEEMNQIILDVALEVETKELAKKLYVALIGNPERYKYIANLVDGNEITQEEATQKNINKALRLAAQFVKASNSI